MPFFTPTAAHKTAASTMRSSSVCAHGRRAHDVLLDQYEVVCLSAHDNEAKKTLARAPGVSFGYEYLTKHDRLVRALAFEGQCVQRLFH